MALEVDPGGEVVADIADELPVSLTIHSGLTEEVDRTAEINLLLHVADRLDDNRMPLCLTDEPIYLSMSQLAEDNDLSSLAGGFLICLADLTLEGEDDRAGGIDDLQSAGPRLSINLGRFAVCPEEDPLVPQVAEILVADRTKSLLGET